MKTLFEIRLIKNLIITVLSALALFLLVESVIAIADFGIRKESVSPAKVISIQGKGEVLAVPDIATFSFTVTENDKDVATAESKMSDKANKALAYLKEKGVEDKDIKTESYNANPTYDYTAGKQVFKDYEVSETVSVKIRDVAKAGEFLAGIANLSIGQVSNLSFTIDSPDVLKEQAKADAIANARENAEATAKSLGVHLGKVVGFYEDTPTDNSGADPVVSPMFLKADVASAPTLQTGQQKITSSVSVTFEIK